MIYSFSIYTRSGSCLLHEKWNTSAGGKVVTYADPEEEKRLLFGLIFSLKEFVSKMSPAASGAGGDDGHPPTTTTDSLQRYQTNAYTCHHYETPSGLRFILMSDNHAGDLTAVLRHIYTQLYVELVVNNPLSEVHTTKSINSQLFRSQLKQYIEGLACFR